MRVLILAVGRWPRRSSACPERELYDRYRERLDFEVEMIEVEERGNFAAAERCRRETQRLFAKLPAGATVVALEETGKLLSSGDFAKRFWSWRERGIETLAFLIGGAFGLAPEARARAETILSLGPMTWPHLLVRPLLLEQLYRAQQIRAGHPYHR